MPASDDTALDPALQAWIDAQLAVAPPLSPEVIALVIKDFYPEIWARTRKRDYEALRELENRRLEGWRAEPVELSAAATCVPAPAQPVRSRSARRVALYRHDDADGVLLYVGISDRLAKRTNEHGKSADWADWIAASRAEWFPTRDAALAAEREAIEQERPIFNRQGAAPGADERRQRYLAGRSS